MGFRAKGCLNYTGEGTKIVPSPFLFPSTSNNPAEWPHHQMTAIVFGYQCQECGQGTVIELVIPLYQTRLKGVPFTVDNARIGVCNQCGAEHFNPIETERWASLLKNRQAL